MEYLIDLFILFLYILYLFELFDVNVFTSLKYTLTEKINAIFQPNFNCISCAD